LFRARSAFKKALVGEAETAGLRVSEILSIAARKAAKESGKYISAAGAFLLVLAISIGVLPNLSQPAQEQIAAPVPAATSSEAPVAQEQPTQDESQPEPAAEPVEQSAEQLAETVVVMETTVTQVQLASSSVPTKPATSSQEVDSERLLLETFLADALGNDAIRSLTRTTTGQVLSSTAGMLTLSNGSGLTANVAFDLATEQGIQHTWFSLDVDGLEFAAVPQVWHSQKTTTADGGTLLSYIATDLLIGDTAGNFRYIASDETAVSTGAVRMEIRLDNQGQVVSSSLTLTSRS
jgi:RNA polymerase sigma-70 factor (ECF subfamily)